MTASFPTSETADGGPAGLLPAEMLSLVVEASSAGIAVADPCQPDLPLVYCNPAFLEMTGYGAGEMLGRNCRFLQGPGTDRATVEELRAAIAEGRPTAVEVLNYRKDGTPFWNAVSLRPIPGPDGSVRWFVASCTDVTRRRQSEQELRNTQEQLTKLAAETFALAEDLDRAREEAEEARVTAENASRAKSRFLAMMSHELRTR
ncbi:PAS domain-containing protein [Azospirillum thermophilum]|uniref:PAS domain-containing protein n=1 Tax=Azospirillum thermophilum TaxID=2202148 RepID=UPI001FE64EF4|nr:PAS domain-containing protein [Azospirillum thermophilum]